MGICVARQNHTILIVGWLLDASRQTNHRPRTCHQSSVLPDWYRYHCYMCHTLSSSCFFFLAFCCFTFPLCFRFAFPFDGVRFVFFGPTVQCRCPSGKHSVQLFYRILFHTYTYTYTPFFTPCWLRALCLSVPIFFPSCFCCPIFGENHNYCENCDQKHNPCNDRSRHKHGRVV